MLIGKEVTHEYRGRGTVMAVENGHITVRFGTDYDLDFPYPGNSAICCACGILTRRPSVRLTRTSRKSAWRGRKATGGSGEESKAWIC